MRSLRFLNAVSLKAVILNIAILALLAGTAMVVSAQDDKQQDDKQVQPEPKKPEEAKPARPDEAKPPKREEKQDEMREQDKEHPEATTDHPGHPADARQGQEHPDQQMRNDHPGNKGGGHIPDKQFHAHFGREHSFHAQGAIVAGQQQFQYSGYTFEFVQAWPAGWAYTDDCYIDFIDGQYFLIDLAHPGVQIALIVLM
jgi:hypothetical protein